MFGQIIDLEKLDKSDNELWQEYRKKYQKDYSQKELEYRF